MRWLSIVRWYNFTAASRRALRRVEGCVSLLQCAHNRSLSASMLPAEVPFFSATAALLQQSFRVACIWTTAADGAHATRLRQALARCALVAWDESTLLDECVHVPPKTVANYLTRITGLTEASLRDAAPFEEVQQRVLALLEGRVLVGHGLSNDLKASSLDESVCSDESVENA